MDRVQHPSCTDLEALISADHKHADALHAACCSNVHGTDCPAAPQDELSCSQAVSHDTAVYPNMMVLLILHKMLAIFTAVQHIILNYDCQSCCSRRTSCCHGWLI